MITRVRSAVSRGLYYLIEMAARLLALPVERIARLGPQKSGKSFTDLPDGGISVLIHSAHDKHLLLRTIKSVAQVAETLDQPVHWIILGAQECLEAAPGNADTYITEPGSNQVSNFFEAVSSIRHRWCLLIKAGVELNDSGLAQVIPWMDTDTFSICGFPLGKVDSPPLVDYAALSWCWLPYRSPLDEHTTDYPVSAVQPDSQLALLRSGVLLNVARDTRLFANLNNAALDWGLSAAAMGLVNYYFPGHPEPVDYRSEVSEERDRGWPEVKDAEQVALWHGLPVKKPGLGVWVGRDQPLGRAKTLLRKRLGNSLHPILPDQHALWQVWTLRQESARNSFPWVIWVSPFNLFPASHGGARRLLELGRVVSEHFRIALICDEGWMLDPENLNGLDCFDRVHLQVRKHDRNTTDRSISRIREHSHMHLQSELIRVIRALSPRIVELQYEELLGLIQEPLGTESWIACLHDVNLGLQAGGNSKADHWVNRQLRRLDAVICCSREDSEWLDHAEVVVVENGVNLNEFQQREFYQAPPEAPWRLLFVGPFRYQPNVDAIEGFLERVYPRLKAVFSELELIIVNGEAGLETVSQPELFGQPGVSLTGVVHDMPGLLKSSTVVINPSEGVRGSALKTIEALASGRVLVATKDAMRGFTDVRSDALVVCPSVDSMAEPLIKLLSDSDYRRQLEAADQRHLHNFDWSVQGQRLMGLYDRLSANG